MSLKNIFLFKKFEFRPRFFTNTNTQQVAFVSGSPPVVFAAIRKLFKAEKYKDMINKPDHSRTQIMSFYCNFNHFKKSGYPLKTFLLLPEAW
jgi:hypothetical protein